jgi:hypothetical protein
VDRFSDPHLPTSTVLPPARTLWYAIATKPWLTSPGNGMALKPKVGGAAAKTIGFSLAPEALKNMAKLGMHFGTHGGSLKIYVGIFQVGSGTFTAFDNSEIDFTGSYQPFGQPAPSASASTSLRNPAATSGACEVTLNASTDSAANYEVDGTKLTTGTTLNPTPVTIYASQGGTQIDGILVEAGD